MGFMKRYLEEWLENYGWELGYDMANVPELGDLDAVVSDGINAEEYWSERKRDYKEKNNG